MTTTAPAQFCDVCRTADGVDYVVVYVSYYHIGADVRYENPRRGGDVR